MNTGNCSKEIPAVDRIVDLFSENAEEVFDDDTFGSLRACVRIALEFGVFLGISRGQSFPTCCCEATMDAIALVQSGQDCFFDLFYLNRTLVQSRSAQVAVEDIASFECFKVAYFFTLDRLHSPSAPLQERLATLLQLGKLQFIFVGLAV